MKTYRKLIVILPLMLMISCILYTSPPMERLKLRLSCLLPNNRNRSTCLLSDKLEMFYTNMFGLERKYRPPNPCKSKCANKTFLVFVCSSKPRCEGWANRFRGIVTTFLLSKMMDRELAIVHDRPCELSRALNFSNYNWYGCNGCFNIDRKTFTYNFINDLQFTNNVTMFDFERIFVHQVEYIRTNRFWEKEILQRPEAKVKLASFQNMSHYEIYLKVFQTLFKPSHELQLELDAFLQQHQRDRLLVCSQIRVGRSTTMPDEPIRMPHPEDIFNFLDKYNDSSKYKIFLGTDSDEMKSRARGRYGKQFVEVSGQVLHSDQLASGEAGCRMFQNIILEQLILSKCDVQLIIDSGISIYAAYMRPKLTQLYCYYRREIVNCTQNDFWDLYLKYV